MNRSTDLQVLKENPEAAGQVAAAIRKGIVKGFLAVKNYDKDLSEKALRKLYGIPEDMLVTWFADKTILFWSPNNEKILITQDGDVQRGEQ